MRRRMMMAARRAEVGLENYIQDGLVLHLDGIDKGPNEGAWTDLTGGVVFNPVTETTVFGKNYVNGTLQADAPFDAPASTSTIEVGYKANGMGSVCLFNAAKENCICAGYSGGYGWLFAAVPARYSYYLGNQYVELTTTIVSTNINLCMKNLTPKYVRNDCDYWVLSHAANVNSGAAVKADIYFIRIYNRLLTEDEMRHNQVTDIRRFRLRI